MRHFLILSNLGTSRYITKRDSHNKMWFKLNLQNEQKYESIFHPFSKILNKFPRKKFCYKRIPRCCIPLISILQKNFNVLLLTIFNIIWLYDFVFIDVFHLSIYYCDYYRFHYLPSL